MSSEASPPPWSREDTERWLNDWPLPADFTFRGEKVWPRYTLKKGYGFWLRTAGPYHPAVRGLFAHCHEILAGIRIGEAMPSAEQLAAKLREAELSQMEIPLTPEDLAPPPMGQAAAEKFRAEVAAELTDDPEGRPF